MIALYQRKLMPGGGNETNSLGVTDETTITTKGSSIATATTRVHDISAALPPGFMRLLPAEAASSASS